MFKFICPITDVTALLLKPQIGPQEKFLSTQADIAVYGGAAGGGKTYALLFEPLRHMNVDGYSATIFRRNATQITIDGGLLDESMSIYGFIKNAVYKASPKPHWTFNGKAKVSFMHIDGDKDLPKWQGSQICCELKTPVLMADGSYKNVGDLQAGDLVMTLQGAEKVIFAGEPLLKDCIEVELPNGKKQIQSTNHKLLTKQGWLSYDDKNYDLKLNDAAVLNYSGTDFHILRYEHPYTGAVQTAKVDYSYQSLKLSPCGKKWVRNISVFSQNHYITETGLVNKNCFLGFDELTHFCLTPEHEVLTEYGWRNIQDIKAGDKVPSLNVNGTIELKKVLDVPNFEYNGNLISIFQKNGISAVMTPNHKIPVKSQKKQNRSILSFCNSGAYYKQNM